MSGGLPVPSGVVHPLVLRGQPPLQLLLGAVTVLGLFLILPGVIAMVVVMAVAGIRQVDDVPGHVSAALAYHFPEGVLASHLGLASMILVVWVLMRHLHATDVVWTASVQPGMRWRYLIVCALVAVVLLNLLVWIGPESPGQHWQSPQPGWYVFLGIILVSSPLQAAAEEVLFRGYLQQTIGSLAGQAWVGVVVSAVVFAVFHGVQNPPLFLHRLGFGLVAGALVIATGGLEAAIAVHVVNNLMAFGYALFTGGVAATAAVTAIPWGAAAWALLGFAACAAVSVWISRRMNVATLTPTTASR